MKDKIKKEKLIERQIEKQIKTKEKQMDYKRNEWKIGGNQSISI